MTGCKLFDSPQGLYEASFVARPNRFLVRSDLGGSIVDAHCPNPGRLLEILVPGTPVLLRKQRRYPDSRRKAKPQLEYSLVAARHRGVLIPLASVRANELAERIVVPLLFPHAQTIRREITVGESRLDFLLELGERAGRRAAALPGVRQLFLEVKGCTLIEEGTAMFPDAPTLRGLKHLEELEALADQGRPAQGRPAQGRRNGAQPAQGRSAGILFLLMNPQARRFIPNLHTDPAFTRKLMDLSDRIWMRAVSIRTADDGTATVANLNVPIDLEAAAAVREDSGAYLLILELQQEYRLTVGSLGEIRFESGWYVYVGSGKRNLSARIARHQCRRKKLHWHIDFLLACVRTGNVVSLPVRSRRDLECPLAEDVAALAPGSTPGFGCSDCSCPSHLFRFDRNPLSNRGFLDLLLHYRHTVALDSSS